MKILHEHYTTSPRILGAVKSLTRYREAEAPALIDEATARNPDRKIQAMAYQGAGQCPGVAGRRRGRSQDG